MVEENWEAIDEVAGAIQAEMLRGLLEAQGFKVWLSQEGAGRAYGLTLSTLGAVQILVPADSAPGARKVLDDYYAGLYEKENLDPDGTDSEADTADKADLENKTDDPNASDQG